jgi:hypothetical protein
MSESKDAADGVHRRRNDRQMAQKRLATPSKRDEPLFEISTDKVDAEIPAPTSGVLSQIMVRKARPSPSTPS